MDDAVLAELRLRVMASLELDAFLGVIEEPKARLEHLERVFGAMSGGALFELVELLLEYDARR